VSRKVWYISSITKNPQIDISDAERFGKLFPIFSQISPFHVHNQKIFVYREMFPFATADDLIILAGPAPQIMTLSALWFQRFSVIRFLVWDARANQYVERFLNNEITDEMRKMIRGDVM